MSNISLPEFADKLNEVMPAITREFLKKQSHELFSSRLTIPQLIVLNFLDKQGPSKMTDLAHFMEVSTAAMTGIVDRLVKYGYVVRLPQTEDRRIIKVGLSPKGEHLLKKVNIEKRQMIIRIFGKISQREREDYLNILLHLRDILTRERQLASQ